MLKLLAGRPPRLNSELLIAGFAKPDDPAPDGSVLAFNAIDGVKRTATQIKCFGSAERIRTFHWGYPPVFRGNKGTAADTIFSTSM
jgi:hypothetical protein